VRHRNFVVIGLTFCLMALLTAVSAGARADVATDESIPVSFTLADPCTGELIAFSGNIHVTSSTTTNSSGGIVVSQHINYQGVSGVGLISGDYRLTGTENDKTLLTNGADVVTQEDSFNIISEGSSPNSLMKTLFHVTYNADGTVTTVFDDFRLVCQ
jgi:hypothetical protein